MGMHTGSRSRFEEKVNIMIARSHVCATTVTYDLPIVHTGIIAKIKIHIPVSAGTCICVPGTHRYTHRYNLQVF